MDGRRLVTVPDITWLGRLRTSFEELAGEYIPDAVEVPDRQIEQREMIKAALAGN